MPGLAGALLTLLLPGVVAALVWWAARRTGRVFAAVVAIGLLGSIALAWSGQALVTADGGPKGSWGYTWHVVAAAFALVGFLAWTCRGHRISGWPALALCIGLSYAVHFYGLWVS